ncbi:MAG: TauD/TfdA family dioxygenase [Steroidobacteraceae bacterium]
MLNDRGDATVSIQRLDWTPAMLAVEWSDGRRSEFASIWLRDNLSADRDAFSGQRLIDVADLPRSPRIRRAELLDGVLALEWEGESAQARFTTQWLARQAAAFEGSSDHWRPRLWRDGAARDAVRDFAWATPGAMGADPAAFTDWLRRLIVDGMAFLADVPTEPGTIVSAVSPIGQVAQTNYGLVFDVRSVVQPENLAYSDRGLGLHTDNPYREPVPGFQALHVLLAAPDGGESLFADGFAIAAALRQESPEDFEQLTRTAVPFVYRSRDAFLQARRPLIQLSCAGEVIAVHYNSRSIAPFPFTAASAERYYGAYRRFAEMLRDPRFALRFMMRAGNLVVFDNQRILHGRTAFTSARHPRHLQGCYLTRDSVRSRAALLGAQPGGGA